MKKELNELNQNHRNTKVCTINAMFARKMGKNFAAKAVHNFRKAYRMILLITWVNPYDKKN